MYPELDYVIHRGTIYNGTDIAKYQLKREGDFVANAGQHMITVEYDDSLSEGQYYLYMFNNNYGRATSIPTFGYIRSEERRVGKEFKDEKMTNRSRKIKFFLDKMKAQENQTDSVAKLVKDLIVRKAITWVKAAAPIVGLVLLLLVLVATIAVPVIAAIAILYNSPFAVSPTPCLTI